MVGDGSLAQESKRQDWLKRTAFLLKKKKSLSTMLMLPGFQSLKIIQTLTDGAIEPSFFSFVQGWMEADESPDCGFVCLT